MEAFIAHEGVVATLDRANVDTDQIIAKQFLKSIKRTGFGDQLFYDWRFKEDGTPDPDFELNQERFKDASILVARNNFGCGSSREHAVWAVLQYGFKVVIAPSMQSGDTLIPGFADIFRNNSGKNGLLTIELSAEQVDEIFEMTDANDGLEATVNLEQQTIALHTHSPIIYQFEIDPAVRESLLKGLDPIGQTLQHEDAIAAFETQHNTQIN